MEYLDFVVEAMDVQIEKKDKQRIGRFKVRVLDSPTRAMTVEQATPVEYDDKELQSALAQLDRRALDREGLVSLGRTLALLLFPPGQDKLGPNVRDILAENLNTLGLDRGLRLRLRLPRSLAALPWEYVYVDRAGGGNGLDGFLALDPRIAIVRHETEALAAAGAPLAGDIKVVVALASAEGFAQLDLSQEQSDLEQAFEGNPALKPVFLPDATLSEILSNVDGAGVFHFAGHGTFEKQMGTTPGTFSGTGEIALDDRLVPAEQLEINLRGRGIRLAVLGGCETGRRDGFYTWSGIAPALVKGEIPAVVANQFSITDKCAIAFSQHFYLALVGGLPIERAVSDGRIAAYNADKEGRDWGVPVLYLRSAKGELFAGAADPTVRQKAREAAEANVNIRVKEVAAGGEVLGAKVREMLGGKLVTDISVSGTVYGKVVGAIIDKLSGGNVKVNMNVGTVTGSVIGIRLDELGFDDHVEPKK
jgi:hypothetical protein